MVMTNKDCKDFANFVQVLQKNNDKKIKRTYTHHKEHGEDMSYENEIKRLKEINKEHKKLNGKLQNKITKLEEEKKLWKMIP
jgi:6-phosphogluconate dehydrogenase (decarboxylating)